MFQFLSKQQPSSQSRPFLVPTPDPFENPLVEINPAQLRQWAVGLPFANPQQLAEAVITSLGRLNRFPGRVKKREELMAIYRTPCNRLQQASLEQRTSLPARLHRQLLQEMAFGYLHLVNDCLTNKPSIRSRKQLQSNIYAALRFLVLEYLIACEEYDCRAMMTRREIMKLHTLAKEQGLQNEPVDDMEQSTNQTISKQTKLTLLLSLLDPCHLQEGEARTVFDYLSNLADAARFDKLESVPEPAGHYVIDRLGEVAPYLFNPKDIETLPPHRFCLFNLIPVSQRLHQDLRTIEKQADGKPRELQHLSSRAAANLLRRMLKSWHIRLERNSERHTTSGQVRLWLGLQPIHRFLTGESASGLSVATDNEEISLALETGGLGTVRPNTYQPLDCWRFNQSRSGVALHLPIPQTTTPQVGEIALIAKPTGNNRDEWKLGIIRRALRKDEEILEIGMQFIHGKIVPLSIQPLDLDEDGGPPTLPALYIDLGGIDRSSLLAPREILEPTKAYRVEEMIPAPVISPVQLTEGTAMFEQFRIRRV
ncbi:MAG: hypothetical protein ABFR65_00260 [Pseudomonadota bacterium]